MTSGLETSDSRIVISSEALKSLSFAFKWSMSGARKREACYLKPSGIAPFTKIDAERRSGAFINRLLETLLPARFHAASALSAPAGHLPLEGKAGDTGETCHRKLSGIAPFRHPERRETSYVKKWLI